MIEYHVIGKVVEEKSAIIIFNNLPYTSMTKEPTIIYLPCEYESLLRYFYYDNHIVYFEAMKVFKDYKECFTIKSDKEFNTGNIINYKDKDYVVTYKYNAESNQHELYIDCETEIIKLTDDEIEQNKLLFDTGLKHREWTRVERDENPVKEEVDTSIFNKIKRIFKKRG